MSVLGVGLDLVDVRSFTQQLSVEGSAFASSTFTDAERREAEDELAHPAGPAQHLAGRFAAKEAFCKAWSVARLGRVPAMSELDWLDLEVLNDPWGRPFLRPSGPTGVAVFDSLGAVTVQLSVTHEESMAAAVVVISAAGAEG